MTSPRRITAAVLALAVLALAGRATAQDFTPAIVFDMGGKFDKSFNEAAYQGAERFKKETGIAYREFEVTAEAQREQTLRNMARRGSQIIVGVGFSQATGMEKVAKEFPSLKFAIVDAVVDLPNVQSIVFKEHEGSFLVGMAAAMASKAGKVGFVGGMDIPLIRKFALGYEEGARYVNPKIEMVRTMPDGPARRDAWRELNREIGANNRAAIDAAQGMVAILDGADVDSGTAAEIGYAFAAGKLIVGYRGDSRVSVDNEGGLVNLQVEFFIRQSGGTIVTRYEDLEPSLRALRAGD